MPDSGVVAGRVTAVHDHPRADRIWLADVDTGTALLRVVFGGRRMLEPGMLVPVVVPGARLGGVKIRRRRFRGEVSAGMLCSRAELGWPPPHPDEVELLGPGYRPGDRLRYPGREQATVGRPGLPGRAAAR
jgi:tRNA-binding EMAP/Myf-like protein